MNIWFKEKKVDDNLTCDVCGYKHDTPDKWGIVVEGKDGLRRCKVCRGAGKFKGVQTRKSSAVAEKQP